MTEHRVEHTLQAADLVADVGGYWLRHYATDFLAAAQTFERPSNRYSPVPYYLVCRSIELSLKAYLSSVGFTKKDRKALNHDLERAFYAAENHERGLRLEITSNEREVLQRANRLYKKKEFEYFERLETVYDAHDFDFETLASLAQRLLAATERPVRENIF